MKTTINELKETVRNQYYQFILESIINEDSELQTQIRKWTGKDIHDKVQKLMNQSSKLRKIASQERKPLKMKMYSRLSDDLMKLAEELNDAYEQTKDPNIIYQVYKNFKSKNQKNWSADFDPMKV